MGGGIYNPPPFLLASICAHRLGRPNTLTAHRHLPPTRSVNRPSMKHSIIALAVFAATQCVAADLKPFTSDGCSSFPNGTPKQETLWMNCCIRHDLSYWQGGTYEGRLAADLALEQCVAKAGEPEIAKLMLQGVRTGGSPHLPTPYRWGYGWPLGRGYQALTEDEWAQVKTQLRELATLLQSAIEALPAAKLHD